VPRRASLKTLSRQDPSVGPCRASLGDRPAHQPRHLHHATLPQQLFTTPGRLTPHPHFPMVPAGAWSARGPSR
jgi:hypothetical protein